MGIKTEKLKELFKEWKLRYEQGDFIEDGIIDEDRWDKALAKVLFLAKETSDDPGDYLARIRNEKAAGWDVAGAWAYAVQNVKLNPSYSEARKPENWSQAFLSSALLNLKKPKGTSSADMAKVLEVAKRDREFIYRELEIMNPGIILCCGTFNVATEIIPGFKGLKPIDLDGKCSRLNDVVWIDFCHFSARWRRDMMYYALQSIYRGVDSNIPDPVPGGPIR